jgi:hypothetical protein
LYPAAATGAYLLHHQSVPTYTSSCQNQHVTVTSQQAPQPLEGRGVTVAVIDSGLMKMRNQSVWQATGDGALFASNADRCIIYRDFLPRSPFYDNQTGTNSTDQNGHGTHVISTIADNRQAQLTAGSSPSPVGVAPQVNLMIARVLDADGAGTYSDVIDAIGWIIANKATYNVRVLNLSLYTPVTGPYWIDPLGQAVMQAWKAGITVVVAAGNAGPEAGTITVPGNVPYVITAGAIKSGRYTVSGDDELAGYSSRGPTESAFVKPDVLVPASRTIAPMPDASFLAREIPEARIHDRADVDYGIGAPSLAHTYYQLSGTSMAAAEVSGLAALILQANPALTNDQVKYRLLATARPALDTTTGQPAYSFWEQGAGRVDVQQAVFTTTAGLANQGMDVGLDLTTDTHYWGATQWYSPTGEFRLIDPLTNQALAVWDGAGHAWSGAGHAWSGAGHAWSGAGHAWSGAGHAWSGGASTWASHESLWAGSQRIWSGKAPDTSVDTATSAELPLDRDPARVLLPLMRR